MAEISRIEVLAKHAREYSKVRREYFEKIKEYEALTSRIPELSPEEWRRWDRLRRELAELRAKFLALRIEREKYAEERNQLRKFYWEPYIGRWLKAGLSASRAYDEYFRISRELPRVLRMSRGEFFRLYREYVIAEVIDIDEETGYVIMYDKMRKNYFVVTPEEYKKGSYKPEKYFKTLEMSTVFAFETSAAPKYGGFPKVLMAEVRITVRIRECGVKLAHTIPDKMRLAFERWVTFFFEAPMDRGRGACPWRIGIIHKIADGVYVKSMTPSKEEIARRLELENIIKAGVFYRVNDKEPNMIVEEEYCKVEVSGEWSRNGYVEDMSEFDPCYELQFPLHWDGTMFVGETGWEQLKRIKSHER